MQMVKLKKAPFEEPEDGSITKSSPGIRLTSPIFSKHADGKVFTFVRILENMNQIQDLILGS